MIPLKITGQETINEIDCIIRMLYAGMITANEARQMCGYPTLPTDGTNELKTNEQHTQGH